jgi:hypothetical protein
VGQWRSCLESRFIAPVFTAFSTAFTVRCRHLAGAHGRRPGLAVIVLLMSGLNHLGGRRHGAAVTTLVRDVESRRAHGTTTMAFFVELGRAPPSRSRRGASAGMAAALAWLQGRRRASTLAIDVLIAISLRRGPGRYGGWPHCRHGFVIGVWFILPHWGVSLHNIDERKPSPAGGLRQSRVLDPLVHDLFTRMWLVVAGAVIALRHRRAGDRRGRVNDCSSSGC